MLFIIAPFPKKVVIPAKTGIQFFPNVIFYRSPITVTQYGPSPTSIS
jgi:hypothetical protein